MPEAFVTAHDAVVVQAGMTLGSRVVVHAVASGVGTAATQLCRLRPGGGDRPDGGQADPGPGVRLARRNAGKVRRAR